MSDNEIRLSIWFPCIGQWWLFSSSNNNRSKAKHATPEALPRHPVTAYSLAQAKALVAAMIAGEVIVVAVTRDGAAR